VSAVFENAARYGREGGVVATLAVDED